jgi:hypothetical protein
MLMSDSIRQMFIRLLGPSFVPLALRLDGVSPYQCVLAKVSLVGRDALRSRRGV